MYINLFVNFLVKYYNNKFRNLRKIKLSIMIELNILQEYKGRY